MNNANGGNILFHFKGDSSQLKSTTSSLGSMTKSILVATGITTALSKAWDMVSSSTDGAIDRYDQLNAFPKVMKSLGVSQDKAAASVKTLSERLKGLPTTLNQGTSAVSRFVAANGDVERSTEMFLAVNNAILAGNAPMENQAAALEQLTQAYSKGKPDMMEWRTLMTAMPGQLKQVAKAMGYVSTDQLHDALMNGSASMDDFMNTIMRLNKEGIEGFDSFETAAKNATGGIKTAITNMKTAVERGMSGLIGSLDKGLKDGGLEGGINGIINKIGEGFESGLQSIGKLLGENLSGLISGEMEPGEVAENLTNFLLDGLKKALEFLKEKIPEYVPKVIEFLTGVIGAIGEALPEIIPLVVQVASELIKALTTDEVMTNIGEAAGKLVAGLAEGLGRALIELGQDEEMQKLFLDDVLPNIFLMGLPIATRIGRAIIAGLVAGMLEALGFSEDDKKQFEQEVQGFIENPLKVLYEPGLKVIEGLWNGIQEALGLKKPGKDVKGKVKDNVGDPSTWLWNAGKNLIEGFINGIESQYAALTGAANYVAGLVSSIVSKKNQIHSPSKLMEWYGEMMGEGYEIGLENMKGAIMDTAFDTFSISPQLQNSSALNYTPNVVVNNYVRNETDPLGQTVSQIKTFANGAKNDYNYGMGV